MISLSRKLLIPCVMLMLAGCGGGSSQLVIPNITLAQPPVSSIAAGTTLQFSATISNSNNTTVLWYVDGFPGGNGTVGTISPQGLYSAPNIPPANGSVTISASPQAYPVAITSVIIGISFANVSLNGNYIFALSGTQSGSPWAAAGIFTAHGDGTISNGSEDINASSGVSPGLAFNGSYLIDSNGQGSATFTSSQGIINIQFTLNSQGQAVAMRSDTGTVAAGNLYPQDASALTLTSLNAPYVLSFTGSDQAGKPLNIIGQFVTNGSTTLASGTEDVNAAGAESNQPFSGTYSIGSNSRGTAVFTDAAGTRDYSFYIVSSSHLQFIETDSSGHLSGGVFQQQGLTSTTTLVGSYVFSAGGVEGTAGYGVAGQFSTNTTVSGGLQSGSMDVNSGGNAASSATLTGSFTVPGATGRGSFTLTGTSGTTNYAFYLVSPTAAVVLTTDAGINAAGSLFTQSGGFTTASFSGTYGLQLAGTNGATPPAAAVGTVLLDGAGNLSGSQVQNNNGTLSGALSTTGTYTFSTAFRGTATLITNGGTTSNVVIYPVSSSALIVLGLNTPPLVGTLARQF
ncbi:MAG: hypothetical protein KGJ56_05865 [Gammaproteobacteria bacterium]|nr:hypothetical protein [Gammaproteobacteria bacterium]